MDLSVAHRINQRAWNGGKPWKRTTWAQLRAKERAIYRKEAEHRARTAEGE